jgi:hypothetical protein
MSDAHSIIATPWKESSGTCACCGQVSKTIWGDLSKDGTTLAVYYVQWTIGVVAHRPNIDLAIGAWGEGSEPQHRFSVSLLFQPSEAGGSFMVVDGVGRPTDDRLLCGRSLKRSEVIGTPLATEVFELVDAIWRTEPRIQEVKEWQNFDTRFL